MAGAWVGDVGRAAVGEPGADDVQVLELAGGDEFCLYKVAD